MIEYVIWKDINLVDVTCRGHVTAAEIRDVYGQYRADPDYVPGRPELIDCSQASDVDLDLRSVQGLIRMANQQPPGQLVETHVVMLAYSPWSFGVMRMFESVSQVVKGVRVQACRNDREALDALGIPLESLAEMRSAHKRAFAADCMHGAVAS
jgi:hypothetical protein